MTGIHDLDRQRLLRSAGVSFILWFAGLVALFLVPLRPTVPPKPVFPEIRINLTQAQARADTPAAPQAKPADPEAPQTKPAAPQAKAAATKTKPATPQAKPAVSGKKAAVKDSPPGLGIPNFSTPPTSANRDSGTAEQLDFSSTAETTRPTRTSAQSSAAEFEGTAAQVQKPAGTDGTTVTSRKGAPATTGAAAAETDQSLKRITGTARASGAEATGVETTGAALGDPGTLPSTSPASGATGKKSGSALSALTFEGAPRKLLFPADPSIVLPAHLSRLVDSDRSVTVQFTVRADGTVPGSLVFFTPQALLPAEIRDYLKAEFSRWHFESGTQDGQVRFQYSIRVE